MSDRYPKLMPIDKEPNHQIVHVFGLGKTDRPAYQPLDPRAQVHVLALDLLRVCLPDRVLLCSQMPPVGTPAVREIARDTKRIQQLLELQEDIILPASEHIG